VCVASLSLSLCAYEKADWMYVSALWMDLVNGWRPVLWIDCFHLSVNLPWHVPVQRLTLHPPLHLPVVRRILLLLQVSVYICIYVCIDTRDYISRCVYIGVRVHWHTRLYI
jgi:hypothetical protein